MDKDKMCGAAVERGRITEVTETGSGTAYTVESIDRPGAVTLTIPAMGDRLAAGDVVYFSLFPDGTGIILSGLAGKIVKATATQSAAGLMSAADKTKLDTVEPGGEPNQNAFSNVKVGDTVIAAQTETDTVELAAGDNVTLTPDAAGKKVTVNATNLWSFEAGTAIPANSDLNDYITAGNYRCESGTIANTIQNNPLGTNPFVLKVFDAQETGVLVQWAIQGNGARMFMRRYANNAFSDWVRYTTDDATTGSSGYMSATDKSVLDTSAVRGSKPAPTGATSLDDFTTSGIYWVSSSTYSGWPTGDSGYAILNVFFDGGGARVQELTMYDGNGRNRRYCRMYINARWYAWQPIATGASTAWGLNQAPPITANSDLNNLKTPGNYTSPGDVTRALTNAPPVASNAFILKVMVGHLSNTCVQMAIDVTGAAMFLRYFNRSTWGSWYKYTGTAV